MKRKIFVNCRAGGTQQLDDIKTPGPRQAGEFQTTGGIKTPTSFAVFKHGEWKSGPAENTRRAHTSEAEGGAHTSEAEGGASD